MWMKVKDKQEISDYYKVDTIYEKELEDYLQVNKV